MDRRHFLTQSTAAAVSVALAEGAGRFVVVVHEGRADVALKLASGPRVTQNALLCVVAPLRSYVVPGEKEGRGLAIEATWQPARDPALPSAPSDRGDAG